MEFVIKLNPVDYYGLLDRLKMQNKERHEIFLDELIPKIQNAKIYDENPKESLPYCSRTSL